MGIELGQTIDGKYRVTAIIGEGGMGSVYAGEHLKLHRRVAVKVLKADAAADPETVARFEREAQAAGRIGNDHILEILDIGALPDGAHYMVMEFLDGEPMNARLARRRLTPREIYPLARQVLDGLAAAHSVGIVHRDLKPANLFILKEKAGVREYVKIIDFGISKFQIAANETQHNQTQTGTIIGTPRYMSPEQARGLREADARSDLYSLGVIIYEAVTGRCPFEGASTNDILFKLFTEEPPNLGPLLSEPDSAFAGIVMKAVAKAPAHRFATAVDFISALDAWAETGQGVPSVSPRSATAPLSPVLPRTMRERPTLASPDDPGVAVVPLSIASTTPDSADGAPGPSSLGDLEQPKTLGTQRAWTDSPSVGSASSANKQVRVVAALLGLLFLVAACGIVIAVRSAGRQGTTSPDPVVSAAPLRTPDSAVQQVAEPAVEETAKVEVAPLPAVAESETSLRTAPSVTARGVDHPSPPRPLGESKAKEPLSGTKKPKSDCDPPYIINSKGAREYKEQCF